MNQLSLLEAAKAITGSDYRTAKMIGCSRQRLSNARTGTHQLDVYVIGALAEIAGLDPLQTISEIEAERARTYKEKKDWRRWSGAAIAVLAATLFCANTYDSVSYARDGVTETIHYAHNTNHVRSDEGPLISRVHVMIEPRPQHARHLRVRAWVGRAQRACSSPFLSCGRSSWSPNADYQRRLAPGSRPGR